MNGTKLYTTDVNAETSFPPATLEEIMTGARQTLSNRVRKRTALTSPQLRRDFLTLKLGALEHDIFAVILLDGRHRVIEYVELFRGTIDGASVYPREVVKLALEKGAAACLLLHNDPSGVKDQSQADEIITKRVAAALALIDVRVLDHLIVAAAAAPARVEARFRFHDAHSLAYWGPPGIPTISISPRCPFDPSAPSEFNVGAIFHIFMV